MTKKQAYEVVIKDLKKNTRCKTYCLGCFDCCIKRLYEDLKSFYELDIERAEDSRKKIL